jgi:hypothetical protein
VRTKHDSDAEFEVWVDGADSLRTHVVQAAFRAGWIAQAISAAPTLAAERSARAAADDRIGALEAALRDIMDSFEKVVEFVHPIQTPTPKTKAILDRARAALAAAATPAARS